MSYTTRKSLLEAIRNGDEISWVEFYETYRPLIILHGKGYQLSAEELEDLCQQVLLDVFKMGRSFRYDPLKGRFRNYLHRIISNNAANLIHRRNFTGAPESALEYVDDSSEIRWRQEWRAHVLSQALAVLRTRIELATFQAFELYALKGVPPEEVARFLNIAVGTVYVAKNRAMSKLRKIVRQLQEEEQ